MRENGLRFPAIPAAPLSQMGPEVKGPVSFHPIPWLMTIFHLGRNFLLGFLSLFVVLRIKLRAKQTLYQQNHIPIPPPFPQRASFEHVSAPQDVWLPKEVKDKEERLGCGRQLLRQDRSHTECSPLRIPRAGQQIQLLAGSEISW